MTSALPHAGSCLHSPRQPVKSPPRPLAAASLLRFPSRTASFLCSILWWGFHPLGILGSGHSGLRSRLDYFLQLLCREQHRILHGEPCCLQIQDHWEVSRVGVTRPVHVLMEKPQDLADNLFFFFFFFFLRSQLRHMEVPRPGVKSELQLPTYTTATATPDPSHGCSVAQQL